MAIISRRQYDHPALATAGGSALHASITNLYTVLGDDSMSRYKTFTAVANSSVGVIAHEFGLDFANLKVQIFTGTYPALTLVSDPIGTGWTVAATSGLASRSIDVTAPASGGPHTYAVLVTHESNATAFIPGLVSIGAQTFAGAKTFSSTIVGSISGNAATVTTNANLTGEATSSGSNAVTLINSAVIGKVLTGYSSGAGTVAATDTILQAFNKINGNISGFAPLASPTFTGTVVTPSGIAFIAPALGTPASGVLTNCTGTAAGLTAGNVTTNANLTGEATSSGSNAVTLTNSAVIGKVLTGYSSGAGTVAATDTILQAFNKINGNISGFAPLASPTFTGTVTLPLLVGSDTTNSSSSTTGAFKTAGGLGVAKALFVGTTLKTEGAATFGPASSTNTNAIVNGALSTTRGIVGLNPSDVATGNIGERVESSSTTTSVSLIGSNFVGTNIRQITLTPGMYFITARILTPAVTGTVNRFRTYLSAGTATYTPLGFEGDAWIPVSGAGSAVVTSGAVSVTVAGTINLVIDSLSSSLSGGPYTFTHFFDAVRIQ